MSEKSSKKEQNEYWMCIIGPAKGSELIENGADSPMRKAVESAFGNMVKRDNGNLWSGWGVSEKRKDFVMAAWNKPELKEKEIPKKYLKKINAEAEELFPIKAKATQEEADFKNSLQSAFIAGARKLWIEISD